MPARLASAVWVSPAASRRALIRSAKAALRGRNDQVLRFPVRHADQRITVPGLLVIAYKPGDLGGGWRWGARAALGPVRVGGAACAGRWRPGGGPGSAGPR